MSRTIAVIQAQIIAEKNAQPALSGLTSTSQVSIWNLWSYVVAVAIFIQESLWDLFQTQLDAQIALAPAWTDQWLQRETLKFQYDISTPQVLTLTNFVPAYLIPDTTKQIISRSSVLTKPNRIVSVKVATNTPPQALTTSELTSFQGFLDAISPAGVQYAATSLPPDEVMIDANIFYDGQYAATIQASVISSINTYLANIEFDGYFRISALETAILSTTGVNDVIFRNIAIRPDATPYAGTTFMVLNGQELYNKYPMYAGYAVTESASTHTILTTLTYTVGN